MADFITRDSGERAEFESGMQRDTEEGKARFDLMIPLGVPYADQMITRLAELYARGAVKYEDRNWERANSEAEMARMKSSAFRHFMQWIAGETDEDHAAAVMFNIIAFETTKFKVGSEPEMAVVETNPDTNTTSDVDGGVGDLTEEAPKITMARINRSLDDCVDSLVAFATAYGGPANRA